MGGPTCIGRADAPPARLCRPRRRHGPLLLLLWLPLCLSLCLRAGMAAAQDYAVTIQGERAGTMSVRQDGDTVRVDYSYRNNGRGPDLQEEFRVGPQRQPVSYRVRGRNEFGGEIREDATVESGRLRWSSVADQGDEPAAEGVLHAPLQSTPAFWGQMLRALVARPDLRAPTLGGRTLQAERLERIEIDGGAGPVAVVLHAVTGVDSEPWYLWLRDDAEQSFFAVAWPGFAVVPTGHEHAAARLAQAVQQASAERLRRLQQRAAQPLPGLTLIRGVRWFDAKAAVLRGPSDVYLSGGRIGAITAPGALQAAPAQVIEGAGSTLLPGLIDMHVHMWPDAGVAHLAAGVTTVRDMASENADLALLQQRIERGEIPGPRIVPTGFIEGRSAFSLRRGIVADDLAQALAAVDWYAARGYRQIKLYNSIRPEWVRPLVARAHGHGLKVAGHVPAFMRAAEAVRDGYDELTHINQVMLNFFIRPGEDSRTLLRFTLVAEKARGVRADSEEARRFVALLRRRGTVVDPTLAVFEAMLTQRDGEPNPSLAAIADHLPVLWQRGMLASETSPDAAQALRWRESYARMRDLVAAMHRAGVTLVAGTDGTPGLMLHRELELYVAAGIPAAQALRIATWNGAQVAGVGAETGSIERGKAADLVLVEGNPIEDITRMRRTRLVVKGGVAYAPDVLYAALGMKPFATPLAIERTAAARRP